MKTKGKGKGMTAKEHYDKHLGNFYAWMLGDFELKSNEQKVYFEAHEILPGTNRKAIDLGCGNGVQTIALARLGFDVLAIDFNKQLIEELRNRSIEHNIKIREMDLMKFDDMVNQPVEVLTCMGDTITHLANKYDVEKLFKKANSKLISKGKIVVSFRDLSTPLIDDSRFIPVKSDENRILTCFLEYFDGYVKVTDLLYENENNKWVQKVSSYEKLRISMKEMNEMMTKAGFTINSCEVINRAVYIIGIKP